MKPDAAEIAAFMQSLEQQDWIRRTERRWWPRFVFHYTDIQNAARILESGLLYCRSYMESNQGLAISSASDIVLAGTRAYVKDYVRLYFRPKTPTQYHAEGIRTSSTLSSKYPDAHCPVPVFLLFGASEVLSRDDCRFSDTTLASPYHRLLSTAKELTELKWKQIYHNSWLDMSDPQSQETISRRMAEVVIPNQLDLRALKFIYCRSEAEKETLLHLLSVEAQRKYRSRIVSTTRSDLFYRQHTFLETVRLDEDNFQLIFSPDTKSPGPFALEIQLITDADCSRLERPLTLARPYQYRFSLPRLLPSYQIEIRLDGHLAYRNNYADLEIPF